MPRPKKKVDLWNKIQLPNFKSPNATAASLQIDLWYREQKIWERWTWSRYVMLANFLNLTIEELASVVCVPHSRLVGFQQTNHLNTSTNAPDRAAALLLTLLEAHFCKHLTKDVVENAFPDLSKI